MTSIILKLFGTPTVELDSQPLRIERRKALALLAFLGVTNGRHTRERLATLLWPEHDRKSSFSYLRQTLWQLNKRLPSGVLVADRQEVQLQNVVVDVVMFRQHMRSSADGPPGRAELESALALYRGDFLAGFSLDDSAEFDSWQATQSDTLRHQRAQIHARLLEQYTTQHDYEPAIEQATQWLAFDPLIEEAHRSLMRLFVATGRRHLALEQYETCRLALMQEVGVEPEHATVALFNQIRQQQLVPPVAPHQIAEPDALVEPPHNLPAALLGFFGRSETVTTIKSQFGQSCCRLLTIVGAGGMGKTSLALTLARDLLMQFPDGAYFVDLAPLDTNDSLVNVIAETVDCLFRGTLSPRQQLLNWLGNKRVLLLLDNFEHLLDHAGFVTEMLQAAPRLNVIATSRERLNLREEWTYDLMGLALPGVVEDVEALQSFGSTQLFVDRACRMSRHFSVANSDVNAVVQICQKVEGCPLAIELAASWVHMLTPSEIVTELHESYDFLTSSQRNRVTRHQSLRAVFEHSWRLLTKAEQHVFAQLTVFRSGFDRQAAREVAGASLQMLSTLVEKSLVTRVSSGRYRIPEILRQFGVEKLRNSLDYYDTMQTQHTHFYLNLLEQCYPMLMGNQPRKAIQLISSDIDNIRQAWRWGTQQPGLYFSEGIIITWSEFHKLKSWAPEGLALFERATKLVVYKRAEEADDPQWVTMAGLILIQLGRFNQQIGNYVQATPQFEQALALLEPLGNTFHILHGMYELGQGHVIQGRYDLGQQCIDQMKAIVPPSDVFSLAHIYRLTTRLALSTGEIDLANSAVNRTIRYFEAANCKRLRFATMGNKAIVCSWLNDFETSVMLFEQSLAYAQTVGDKYMEEAMLGNLAFHAIHRGNFSEGLRLFRIHLSQLEHTGDRVQINLSRLSIAQALVNLQRDAEADELLITLRETLITHNDIPLLTECLFLQAQTCQRAGNMPCAIGMATYVVQHPATSWVVREQAQALLDGLRAVTSAEIFQQANDYTINPLLLDLPRIVHP